MHYIRVDSVPAAVDALLEPGSQLIAGGTDLLVKIRGSLVAPDTLVDISDIEELRGIHLNEDAIEIGAATPEEIIRDHRDLGSTLPFLVTVLAQLGSVQIRNRGTLGGNLVNASPAADGAIPLLLYDAELVLVGPTGERTLPLSEFFVGPGKTALGTAELVKSIRVPRPGAGLRSFFHKVGKRRALTISIASVGVLLDMDGTRIRAARFAAGSVAPTPLRLVDLETELAGATLGEATIEAAAEKAAASISPISDIRASGDYRREVVADLVARALTEAASS